MAPSLRTVRIVGFTIALFCLFHPRAATGQTLPTAPHGETFVRGEALTVAVSLDTAAFLNGGYPIDSLGYVDLPIAGRVEVGGRTRAEVEAFLGQKFANYLRDTHVEVKPAIRLTLLGFWTRQGQYYVSPDALVWDAVFEAGGIAGDRNIDKIRVLRGTEELKISFLDEYSRGATLTQAGFRSGDIIVIPIPRDNAGFWYWFRETLTVMSEMAAIVATALTAYLAYETFQAQNP